MRKAITERMKLQAIFFRFDLRCPLCKQFLFAFEKIEWDHVHALAAGGDNDYTNIRPVHARCHLTKTSGTKATSAGSDIHMIAKAKRIASGGKKRKGPKIKSKGFDKTLSRKFNGTTERRA